MGIVVRRTVAVTAVDSVRRTAMEVVYFVLRPAMMAVHLELQTEWEVKHSGHREK